MEERQSKAITLRAYDNNVEVGRASLFFITNDLSPHPYAMIEDVFVEEIYRGKGIGSGLTKQLIETAKEAGCSKLLIQSRYGRENVHALYQRLGFKDHGKNFRMDFL